MSCFLFIKNKIVIIWGAYFSLSQIDIESDRDDRDATQLSHLKRKKFKYVTNGNVFRR